jgi:hypothetical protein
MPASAISKKIYRNQDTADIRIVSRGSRRRAEVELAWPGLSTRQYCAQYGDDGHYPQGRHCGRRHWRGSIRRRCGELPCAPGPVPTLSLCPSGHHLPLPPWPGLADARSPPGRHLQQAIKDGVIAAVGAGLVDAGMKATEVYDATGQHIAPGWIDPHTHFVRSSCSFLSGLQPVPTSWHMQRSPLSLCVV